MCTGGKRRRTGRRKKRQTELPQHKGERQIEGEKKSNEGIKIEEKG